MKQELYKALLEKELGQKIQKIAVSDKEMEAYYKKNPEIIFQPQITSKTDSEGNIVGTGMGMYLVKNTVEENGGSVEILMNETGFSIVIYLLIT